MKKNCLLIVLAFTVFGCQNDTEQNSNVYNWVPENTSVIISTNSLESLKNATSNNELLQELISYAQIKDFNRALQPISYLKPENQILICLSKDKNDSLELSFITPYKASVFELDSVPNLIAEEFTTKNKSITKLNFDDSIYYSTISDSMLFITNKYKLAETSFERRALDPELKKMLDASNTEQSASILINLKQNKFIPYIYKDKNLSKVQLANYLLLDGDIAQNDIFLNGIAKANDSSESIINVFKGTIPQENKMSMIAPSDTDYLMSLTFNNITILERQLQEHRSDSLYEKDNPFENVIEAGYIEKNNTKAIVFRSIDALTTQENLSQNSNINFRSVAIHKFENPEIITQIFSPFLIGSSSVYYFNIEDFFVFSEDMPYLETLISNYQNGTTLSESSSFKDLMLDLSDESSLFVYANSKALNSILNNNFTDDKNLKIDIYKSSALQFIYDHDFAHVNAVFKTHKSKGKNNSASEDFNMSIDASLLSEPQLVSNHTNHQKDIAVQDVNNDLYLISSQGKIFWKKQLEGKILGKIEQIDMYKNGRLQLTFATPNKVYVIDRNGKDVAPFPLKFNDNITQPLSVFDYDNKRNYRLMVTQGKSVLMYDQNGKIVNGFTYKKAKDAITTQPKHFRIGRKDYIVFAEGSTLEILDRTGKQRVNVKEKINFSGNEIYLYDNNFTTSNLNGELLEVNQRGTVNHKNLNLNEKHAITTTSKTLVALSDNKLRIKSHSIDLDFGDYTAPRIFYISDKIYVSVTDLQSKKVYLFDSQAKPIANFPIYGNSAIEMDDIDKDNSLEVIVKGDDNNLIIYEIN